MHRTGGLICLLAFSMLHAADEQRTFEAASVRRSAPDATSSSYHIGPGNRLRATNLRFRDLLMLAWRLQGFQISELSNWMESERFDIEAVAQGTPSEDELRSMLRSLLKERFHLEAHLEPRETAVYSLAIARTGLKAGGLSQTKENECAASVSPATYEEPSPAKPLVCGPRERLVQQGDGTTLMQFYGIGVTMDVLARALGSELEKHVDNDTGLPGSFDFSFEFTPDPGRALNFAGTRFDSSGPSLFTAIEEKLGLQLAAKRGNVEMLVVDRAERPSEN